MESLIDAAQSQSINMNLMKPKINRSQEDLLYRLCKKADESTVHVASAASLLKRSIRGDMTTKVQ